MTSSRFQWNSENEERLRALWADGFSAGAICQELGGGVTRSAILGKLRRLDLKRSNQSSQPKRPKARPRKAKSPAIVEPADTHPVKVAQAPQLEEPIALAEQSEEAECESAVPFYFATGCKWIYGAPGPNASTCNAPVSSADFSFCDHHMKRVVSK